MLQGVLLWVFGSMAERPVHIRLGDGSIPSRPIYPTKDFPTIFLQEGGKMNSFISWIGGKKLLRKKILEQFPEQGEVERYVEVFGGAGWVLFGKDSHASLEVFNDANSELINLYRCVKYHPEALQKELDGLLMSRELFFDAIHQNAGLTDIQRAARFFTAIKESYGSDRKSFGLRPKNLQKAVDFLSLASGRLAKVVIEHQDFEQILKTYDSPKTLFYLDPPYYSTEKYYPDRFLAADHLRLKEALAKISGRFLLSYNDCKEIRDLYRGYEILKVDRANNLKNKEQGNRYQELLIKNYK